MKLTSDVCAKRGLDEFTVTYLQIWYVRVYVFSVFASSGLESWFSLFRTAFKLTEVAHLCPPDSDRSTPCTFWQKYYQSQLGTHLRRNFNQWDPPAEVGLVMSTKVRFNQLPKNVPTRLTLGTLITFRLQMVIRTLGREFPHSPRSGIFESIHERQVSYCCPNVKLGLLSKFIVWGNQSAVIQCLRYSVITMRGKVLCLCWLQEAAALDPLCDSGSKQPMSQDIQDFARGWKYCSCTFFFTAYLLDSTCFHATVYEYTLKRPGRLLSHK